MFRKCVEETVLYQLSENWVTKEEGEWKRKVEREVAREREEQRVEGRLEDR